MTDLYEPFSNVRRFELLARLEGATVDSVDDLETLRHALRPTASAPLVKLDALRAIVTDDPEDADRIMKRIVPALLHHAWALVASGTPSLLQLSRGRPGRVVLPRSVLPAWLAHILLGTLAPPSRAHPRCDAAMLWATSQPSSLAKLRCILDIYDAVGTGSLPGRMTVERTGVNLRTAGQWLREAAPLTPVTVDSRGLIEDAAGHLQVDFANKYLGGGVLGRGCVQEEIRFSVSPECLVAMLVAPVMEPNEALTLHGVERFSQTDGYALSLAYVGRFTEPAARLADGTPDVSLTAIDAVDYRQRDAAGQYTPDAMLRELEKARAGFRRDARLLPVATGNWGAGAFGGDAALKAVLQWLAASSQGRAMRYFTFGEARVAGLGPFVSAARGRFGTVAALWHRLLEVAPALDADAPLFRMILAPPAPAAPPVA